MFTRLAVRLPKASPAVFQARYASKQAFAGGSKGRDMPALKYRTPTSPTAPRAAEATLTIRVRAPAYPSRHLACH